MESIVKFLEKGQPYFDKVSKNIYLQAIKDGFLAAMPIILSSSVFLLISTLPGVVATVGGFTLPDWWNVDVVNFCNKVYNFTMGVVGIMVAGTTASALTGSKNRRMPAGKAINATSTMVAAMCAMLILAVTQTSAKIDGADVSVFFTDNMGTKGLLSSFVAAFATVNIYAFCIKRDITIKLPKEVPGAIAQNFRDIFAFSFSILFVAVIDVICRTCLAVPFANVISTLVSPLFAAADSYAGLALIWFMIPLFWFMGIHGPSVVKPALNAALFAAIEPAQVWARAHSAWARRLDLRDDPLAALPMSTDRKLLTGQVVLVGYGQVGQHIAAALAERHVPCIVADSNREVVEKLRAAGRAAVSGDASDPIVLVQAHITRAAMLVVTTPDALASRQMVDIARKLNPDIEIVLRSDTEDGAALLRGEKLGEVFVGEEELARGMCGYVTSRMLRPAPTGS